MITLKQASAMIDNVVIATSSIQYTRQATYYLLLANNMTSKQLTKLILDRAKVKKVSIARGCLINEIRVAQYCVDNDLIKLSNTTGKNESDLIQVIADYMTSHKLSYYFIFYKRKKASNQQADKASKQPASKKPVDLNQVIQYIKQADKQALELIKQALEARQADKASKQPASKASKQPASKASKQPASKASKKAA